MGGHSQQGALGASQLVSGVAHISIPGPAPTPVPSQGTAYPKPMASYSPLVLLSARGGDEHPTRRCRVMQEVRAP